MKTSWSTIRDNEAAKEKYIQIVNLLLDGTHNLKEIEAILELVQFKVLASARSTKLSNTSLLN